jgi:hypothetical protein
MWPFACFAVFVYVYLLLIVFIGIVYHLVLINERAICFQILFSLTRFAYMATIIYSGRLYDTVQMNVMLSFKCQQPSNILPGGSSH